MGIDENKRNTQRFFAPFDIVRHFKRETLAPHDPSSLLYYYKIIGVGYSTENNELVMIYEALYGNRDMYVRPYDEFMGKVDKEKYPDIKQIYRFELVTGKERTDVIKNIPRW